MSGGRVSGGVYADFASGLQPPGPSDRSLFLRGIHAKVIPVDPAPGGFLDGRRLADWCCERANGVAPDLRVAGVTYWVSWSRGKVRAFYRLVRTVEFTDGSTKEVEFWRAIGAPDRRLLLMRLASRAGVPVSAVEQWPTFADEANK